MQEVFYVIVGQLIENFNEHKYWFIYNLLSTAYNKLVTSIFPRDVTENIGDWDKPVPSPLGSHIATVPSLYNLLLNKKKLFYHNFCNYCKYSTAIYFFFRISSY